MDTIQIVEIVVVAVIVAVTAGIVAVRTVRKLRAPKPDAQDPSATCGQSCSGCPFSDDSALPPELRPDPTENTPRPPCQ